MSGTAPFALISAGSYDFTTTGTSSSIGTSAAPLQLGDSVAGESDDFTGSTGTGGIYLTFWNNGLNESPAITGASVTGGNIQLISAGGTNHGLSIEGALTASSGSITLDANGEVQVIDNSTIGGSGFSGIVAIHGDLSGNTSQALNWTNGSVLSTSNTSASAVDIDSDAGSSNANILVGSITTGNGGTITIGGASGGFNTITQVSGTTLNAGANGHIDLIANVATAGDEVGTSSSSLAVTGATVTTSATNGNAYVTDSEAGSLTATSATGGNLKLATAVGVLTIGGATNTAGGGAITLTGAGGIVVNAALGNATTGAITATANTGSLTISDPITAAGNISLADASGTLTVGAAVNTTSSATVALAGSVALNSTLGNSTTGPISITGALSGTGNITLGTGGLTLSLSTSSYGGSISGNDNVILAGAGDLTLTGTSGYTGATLVNAGALTVNGSLTGTSGVTVASGASLYGSGPIHASVTDNGTVAPGGGAGGTAILAVTGFSGSGTFTADINGATPGTSYDQIDATGGSSGNVNLSGMLNIVSGSGLTLNEQFTIISDPSGTITGQFSNATSGTNSAFVLSGVDYYSATYNTNSVVVTLVSVETPPVINVSGSTVSYTSPTSGGSNVTVSESGTTLTIQDPGYTINFTPTAVAAGWHDNALGSASGPAGSALVLNLSNSTNTIASINADVALTISGVGSLAIDGPITNVTSVAISGYSSVDIEGSVTATGSITVTGVGSITGDSNGGTGTLTAPTVTFRGTGTGNETIFGTIPVVGNLAITSFEHYRF